MDRASAVFILSLLLFSLFTPFGVMAQENGEEEIELISGEPELISEPGSTCAVDSALEVVELDYRQATALQGIVTQDVATSAEEYRRQSALEELGVDTRTDRSKLLDNYNFYFMGPDGAVFYYEVLDDLMRPDNGYLIGTEITGRIEYGGHLRENLAMCGKSPSNVTENVCVAKGDLDKRDAYIAELEKAKTKADLMSFFVSLEGIGELAPADVLDLGQSRIRMTEFTTSMATSGPGSTVFILPQALVIYTAAMKKLDMVDLVVGVVGAAASFKTAKHLKKGANANQRKGFFQWIRDVATSRGSAGKMMDDSLAMTDLRSLAKTHGGFADDVASLDPKDPKQLEALGELFSTRGEQGIKQMDVLRAKALQNIDEVPISKGMMTDYNYYTNLNFIQEFVNDPEMAQELYRLNGLGDGGVSELAQNQRLLNYLNNNFPAGLHSYDDIATYQGQLAKYEKNIIDADTGKELFKQYDDLGRAMKSGDIQSAVSGQGLVAKMERGVATVDLDYMMEGKVAKAEDWLKRRDELYEGYLRLPVDERQTRWGDDFDFYLRNEKNMFRQGGQEVLSPLGYEDLAKELMGEQDAGIALLDGIVGQRAAGGLRRFGTAVTSGSPSAIFKEVFPDAAESAARSGGSIGVQVAVNSLNRLAIAIYTSPGTLAVMVARGLHSVNDLFFRQGFFELSGAGLTLRYNKDEIGEYYQDDSVIVLLAQNSLVKGLLSSYTGGELGAIFFGVLGQVNENMEPLVSKANLLGDVLVFGGIMYPPSGGVIEVVEENPTGTTHIEQKGDHYIMHIREWDDHVYSAVEDVRTMHKKGGENNLVTAMGMWTNKIDLYGHMYEDEQNLPGGVFTQFDSFIKKIGNWGVFTNMLLASSSYSLFFTRGTLGGLGLGASVLGAPLGLFLTTKSSLLAGEAFVTAQYTDMEDLSQCVRTGESDNPDFTCDERKNCATVLSSCLNQEGMGSTGMVGTAVADVAIASMGLAGPAGAVIVLADVALAIYKIQLREACLRDLGTCQEHTFTIIGAASYSDPVMIAEQQQAEQLKSLPGLENLPVGDFLDASGLGDVTNPLEEFSQQQLNVHTEGYDASGRIAMDEVYYAHLQDVSVQWLEGNLPINLCSLDDAGNPMEETCLNIQGESVTVGGRTIVTDELVPFKWMDTELPALVIPNTAIAVNTPAATDCMLFSVDKTGTRLTINQDVVTKFEEEGFDEVARMMGTLRVINTDGGSIYPSVDYNGDFRFEHDRPDGSFGFSEEDATVTATANVLFNDETLGFESAVFTGGSIIKKGDKIYILPKYFMPTMSGKQWLDYTQGVPLRSVTGEQLEVFDAQNNLLGLNAAVAGVPGGDKLGTITRLDAWKDMNGDGEVQDEEKAGWRFFTDEDNETKFELFYNGEKEIYDADQVEIDEATGDILVYEKDQPHVEANLLREIQTKVDSLGRTLLTINDGKGNILLEEALVTYLKGTGGAIRYDADNNNYIFVNGQPVELNNDFKLNGFNPITGRTDPPLLQPSSVRSEVREYEGEDITPPAVPLRGEGAELFMYLLFLFAGMYFIYRKT
ncbi:hypothetical protein ACFLQ2_00865 [archaeon]